MTSALPFSAPSGIHLMGDDPENAEDRALSTQASASHMQRVLAKLRGRS